MHKVSTPDWPQLISPLRTMMIMRGLTLNTLAARCTNISRQRLVELLRCELPTEDEGTALAFTLGLLRPEPLYRKPSNEWDATNSMRWHDPEWCQCCWCGTTYPHMLCDAPVPLRPKSREYSTMLERTTCSAHICDGCATQSGDDLHLCPEHRHLPRQIPLPNTAK